MRAYTVIVVVALLLAVGACRSAAPRSERQTPVTSGSSAPPPPDPRVSPTPLAPGEMADDCGFGVEHVGERTSGPVREHLVLVARVGFSESAATLDDAALEDVRDVFEHLREEVLARGLVLRGVARGAVEEELARARLRSVRAAFEARGLPAELIGEEVVRPSESEEPDSVSVYFVCPVTLPVI